MNFMKDLNQKILIKKNIIKIDDMDIKKNLKKIQIKEMNLMNII